MLFYQNLSCSDKTFYGVTFKPKEVKGVPGYINDRFMVIADEPEAPTKQPVQKKPSSVKPKKEVCKDSEEPIEVIPDRVEAIEVTSVDEVQPES